MPLFWFLTGALATIAALLVALPWLRRTPRFAPLPALPWGVPLVAIVALASALGFGLLGHPTSPRSALRSAADVSAASDVSGGPNVTSNAPSAFTSAAKAFADSAGGGSGGSLKPAGNPAGAAPKNSAGSMNSAIASLESRLAKGGGSDGDWELLAKSFDFLGRPSDAAKARAHQLPPVPNDEGAAAGMAAPMASSVTPGSTAPGSIAKNPGSGGAAISGEITLASALKAKASAGEILFIVAKSVDTPGVPVAVFRSSVGSWPVKFTLDDSQSMLPGRNLSSAGRVTIEARISLKGQPLPASGDLQGSSGVVDPADHRPLKITIDRVIS